MNNMLLDILVITICLFLLSMIIFMFKKTKNLKNELSLKEYEININSNIDDTTFALLDKIITECFSEYVVLNVEYKDITYINSELEEQLAKAVAGKVLERLSPTLISKISLVYNINNLSILISERVYLHILNYSIEKNSMK